MIDTVKLRSPFLSQEVAAIIEEACTVRQVVSFDPSDLGESVPYLNRRTGEIREGSLQREVVSVPLVGSYDARISLMLHRVEWVRDIRDGKVVGLVARPCEPYIEVECSLHKFLLGHNVFGGPANFRPAVYAFLAWLGRKLAVDLPPSGQWQVCRVDVAHVYVLPCEAIIQYLRGLALATFPRRGQVQSYGSDGIACYGSTTGIKLYHKGPEFVRHDRPRLRRHLDPDELARLTRDAWDRLRVEVEIRKEKLTRDWGGVVPTVDALTDEYLLELHDREVFRLLREGAADMKTVRLHDDVRARLGEVYSSRVASTLYAFWVELSTLGEKQVKGMTAHRTYFRKRKQLVEAGVTWFNSDVQVVVGDGLLPPEFLPLTSSGYAELQEAPLVAFALLGWREQLARAA